MGGKYEFKTPKQLLKVNGEQLVARTIRLLKENGIENIYISATDKRFEKFGVPVLKHNNDYEHITNKGSWLDAYYPTEEPTCYLHGDVYFSPEAIKKIINAKTNDSLFICTFDGNDKLFIRNKMNTKGREPFGYIVVNQKRFREGIEYLKSIQDEFKIHPFSWHLYRYLNGMDLCKDATEYTQINDIFYGSKNYLIINDYTRDIDNPNEIEEFERNLKEWNV